MVRAPEPGRAVPLTSELERRVEDQDRVRTGIYGSASEVSREALRLFFRYDQARMSEVDNLDHRIGVGSAELDRGLGIPGDEARRRSRSRSLDQLPPPDQVSLGYVLAPAALADNRYRSRQGKDRKGALARKWFLYINNLAS